MVRGRRRYVLYFFWVGVEMDRCEEGERFCGVGGNGEGRIGKVGALRDSGGA